jgi:hypothetical protein
MDSRTARSRTSWPMALWVLALVVAFLWQIALGVCPVP